MEIEITSQITRHPDQPVVHEHVVVSYGYGPGIEGREWRDRQQWLVDGREATEHEAIARIGATDTYRMLVEWPSEQHRMNIPALA